MLIGSKNLEIYSNVVPTVHNFALLPPNEPILGNDNTSPICSPNGVWAAQAAFAPRVANAKFFVSSDEWFADTHDILLFARTAHETIFLLESLMQEFAEVGLLLNGEKTVVLINEPQPPSHLRTRTGIAREQRVWWTQMAWMHPRFREGRKYDCGPQPPLTSCFQSILC